MNMSVVSAFSINSNPALAMSNPRSALVSSLAFLFVFGPVNLAVADDASLIECAKQNTPNKIELKKYDPVVRQHVIYKEKKLK